MGAVSSGAPLHAALLSFAGAPGHHQVRQRQPAALFDAVSAILRIAAAGSTPETQPSQARVREAALFFVRMALLYPGADHYAVFGLAAGAEPVDLKERYRLLARLVHPDRAAASTVPWPADAAARMNRAYEVLSSPELRKRYDAERASPPVRTPARMPRRPRPRPHAKVLGVVRLRSSWFIVAAIAASAVLVLPEGSDGGQLVQAPARAIEALQLQPARLLLTRQLPRPGVTEPTR